MIKLIKSLLAPKIFLWLLLSYTAVITILFLTPKLDISVIESDIPIDKIGHTIIYLILTLGWLYYLFVNQNKNISKTKIGKILLICFLYGIIIEVIQQVAIPFRQADILDVVANTFGLYLGYKVFLKIIKNRIV